MNKQQWKKTDYGLTAVLLLMAVFLRVYRMGTLPLGMHIDEAGVGLNAWSIAHYGTDRYGNFMPVCPLNFYGEQSAFYTYFCALLVKIAGLNIYTLRLPGVIMGIVAVVFGALLMKEKWGKKGFLTGLALLGIFPYFIMNCRFALDCNAMLGALTVALYGLMRLVKKAQREEEKGLYGLFFLEGILLSVVLYTYIVAVIVMALFCLTLGIYYLLYRKENRPRRFRQLLCMALPLCVLVVPLVMVFAVNYLQLDTIRTPFFTVPKLIVNRTEELTTAPAGLMQKFRYLIYPLTSDGKYGSSDRYWTLYYWSVPFIVIGGIYSLIQSWKDWKQKIFSQDWCMVLITVAQVVMFLLCGQYNYHINGIFIALAYFCVGGIFATASVVKGKKGKAAFAAVVSCLYLITFVGFAKEYYGTVEEPVFQVYGGVDEAVSWAEEHLGEKEIYVMDEVGEFYFLSNPIPPSEYAQHCDELGYLRDMGNIHFHPPDSYDENAVYVCNKASGYGQQLRAEEDAAEKTAEAAGLETGTYQVMETEHYQVFYTNN